MAVPGRVGGDTGVRDNRDHRCRFVHFPPLYEESLILRKEGWYLQQYLVNNPDGYCGIGGTGVSCPIGVAKANG
ncbi:hypothetical protein GCM10017778_16110 [Streptomyces vinaceus]|nr:hypothetical protein GCM10017778_16110 [Streptomyces vinaceus]